MKRAITVAILLFTGLSAAWAQDKPPVVSVSKPNIVLFFVDDLGWTDLGFRNANIESPNIDELARQGISFEQAWFTLENGEQIAAYNT